MVRTKWVSVDNFDTAWCTHSKATMSHDRSLLAPCLGFRSGVCVCVCGVKDGVGHLYPPLRYFWPWHFNLLTLLFLCCKKEKVVSSQVSYELKIGSWMCKGLLDEKPTFVFHSIKQFCDAPSPIPFILPQDRWSVCLSSITCELVGHPHSGPYESESAL